MKQIAAAIFASAFAMSAAQAALVDFNGLGPVPTDVTTQYAGLGVTFSGIADDGSSVNVQTSGFNQPFSDNNPTSPFEDLSNFYGGSPFNRARVIRIDFSSPSSGISFQYNAAGGAGSSTVFRVRTTLGSFSFSDPFATDSNFHLETVSAVDVVRIDIISPSAGWGHYIDDLSFTPGTPGTGAPDAGSSSILLGLGFGALTLTRRNRA